MSVLDLRVTAVVLCTWTYEEEEETRYWRKVYNEELHNLYSLPNVIRIMKLRRKNVRGI
jgi:hypothetical protein